jgi:NAD(P)-dependent dehydrogenase (short-subunit alcohol dehydrogenase family)
LNRIDVAGRTAVVTGGASGLGFAIAERLAASGAKVVIWDIDASAARAAAEKMGGLAVIADVSNNESVAAAVKETLASTRGVDILINNAGITQPVKVWDITSQDWDRIQDVNLRGVLYLSQALMPHMRAQKAGSIACMSSVSAQRGGGILGGAHYSAAKAGVLGLAKAMARELGPDNIRVNCVTPGLIVTDINIGKIAPEKETEILAGIPLNRLGQPQDVANIFLFLASDLSAYTTGAVIDVNGGMHIH